MFLFLAKRLRYSLLVLLGVITLVFFLFNVLPGDPARLTMGQRSDLQSLENVRKEMNLDKPILTRYFLFLNDLSPISIHKNDATEQKKYSFIKIISFLVTIFQQQSYYLMTSLLLVGALTPWK